MADPKFPINESLRNARNDRIPHKEDGMPVRHLTCPIDEQELYLQISRKNYINYVRYMLGWARITFYNLFWNVPPTVEKHLSTVWLFPAPSIKEALQFPVPDSFFALERFCGPHTNSLTRLTTPFNGITENLTKKLENGKLFNVNYNPPACVRTKGKMRVPKAAGVFSLDDPGEYKTECLVIDGKIITPASPGLWAYAKACFQSADAVYYLIVNRLCGAFLFLEPISLYFFRNVPPNHPLFDLFKPIFKGHATSCYWLRKSFLKEGGDMNRLLPLTTESIQEFVKHGYSQWSFANTGFAAKLQKRSAFTFGTSYPYAEDGMEILKILQNFAGTFVNSVYKDDSAVIRDVELQRWLYETAKEGNTRDFPSSIDTRASLSALISHLMFLFMFDRYEQHFNVYEYMPFLPSFPVSVSLSPEHANLLTSDEVMHLLGKEKDTLFQFYALYTFCHEFLPPLQWRSDEIGEPLFGCLQSMDRAFQHKKTTLRDRLNIRPTPFRHFILRSGFLVQA